MADKYDLAVIGSGPGGYVAAIRGAQLGLKTAIIEKRKTLGGTCLNVGCIPSKALLDSSEQYHIAQHKLKDHGVEVGDVKLNLKQLMSRKDTVVSEVCEGVDFLMKKNKITRYEGFGSLTGNNGIDIQSADGKTQSITADHIILASGSVPIEIPSVKFDDEVIISSDQAIALTKVPKKLLIVGAGVIGLELGSVWSRLGAEVTILEMMPGILAGIDRSMGSLVERTLAGQGMKFRFGVKVESGEVKNKKGGLTITNEDGKQETLTADKILVAVGRKPFTEGLGLDKAGVELTERGRIKTDGHFKTNVPGIYAIGDVIDGPMLAHKAEDEGIAVAELIAGQSGHVNYDAIPWIIYTWPEVAWVGKGEDQLKEEKIPYKTGRSIFRSNARAKAMMESEGQVKVLAHKETDKLLGLWIVGPRASDMIIEAAIAMEFGASAEDIARSTHAHPTLSEVVREAAMGVDKWSIHG